MHTTNRLWHVVAAVGLALLAAMLTTFYVANYKRTSSTTRRKSRCSSLPRTFPVDTTGAEILAQHLLTKVTVVRRQVVPGAISRPEQLRNLIATQPVFAGEQVTARRFGTPAERGVRAQISAKQRAIEVDGDAHQLLAGRSASATTSTSSAPGKWLTSPPPQARRPRRAATSRASSSGISS